MKPGFLVIIAGSMLFVSGIAVGRSITPGKLTSDPSGSGWKLEHIPYPDCPDGFTLSVDMPELDEVNRLTITCSKTLPNPKLGLDSKGRTL